MPYSAWPYFRSINPTSSGNLTTTLLTTDKQQNKELITSEYVFPTLKCYQIF